MSFSVHKDSSCVQSCRGGEPPEKKIIVIAEAIEHITLRCTNNGFIEYPSLFLDLDFVVTETDVTSCGLATLLDGVTRKENQCKPESSR